MRNVVVLAVAVAAVSCGRNAPVSQVDPGYDRPHASRDAEPQAFVGHQKSFPGCDERVVRSVLAEFDAQDVECNSMIVLTSFPPKTNVWFTVNGKVHTAQVTWADDPETTSTRHIRKLPPR